MRVVVVGDVNVDMEIRLPRVETVAAHSNPEPRLFGGGSAANTAAALGRLGLECRFVGTVGDDSFGRHAKVSLEEAGVDCRFLDSTGDLPTVAVITVVPRDGDRLIYVWPPSGGAHQEILPDTAMAALEAADWLHVSGICLRVTPARDTLLEAMARARALGIPVSLDLSLRLENWGWDDGFRQIIGQAIDLSDVVMGAGYDEIVPLATSGDPIDAARELASDDRLIVARLGADGSLAASADNVVSAPGFEIDLVDTVGAGDAHSAGFIFARLRGSSVEDALRWGNAVAALTVSQAGARSTPTLAEAEAFLSVKGTG